METDIEETPSKKPPSIVISKPPSIIISKVNETTSEKEELDVYKNVKESENNQFNTKKFLIGFFTPGVVLILFFMTIDYLDDKHDEWEEEYTDNYYYEFYDYDIPPEPIDLDYGVIFSMIVILLFIYIIAIIYAFFVSGQKDLGLGLITTSLLMIFLGLYMYMT